MSFFRPGRQLVLGLVATAVCLPVWAATPLQSAGAFPAANVPVSPPGAVSSTAAPIRLATADPARMTRMLDELDRQEMEDLIHKARGCIRSRDFICADKQLTQAGKLSHTAADRQLLADARADFAQEQNVVAQEQELARQQREEEERQEREQAARERQEAAERAAEEEQERQQMRLDLINHISDKMQEIANVQAESARQVQQAQALAAQANRDRQEAANREYERKRAEQEEARRKRQEALEARQLALNQQREAADAARQQQEERARQQREADQREREAREEKQRVALAQQQAAEERKRKAAEEAAAKRAEEEANRRADQDYLRSVAAGTRLRARKCPDGEGKYYVVGIMPDIKPHRVSCTDLHYTATCPGSAVRYSGVGKNFIGISTDCFMGDTYEISPKPACKVEEVSMRVDAITPCE